MPTSPDIRALSRLARLYGVQTAYHDALAQWREASVEALLAVLRSLGAPVNSLADVAPALRARRLALWERSLEPVAVAWEGKPLALKLRLPASKAGASMQGNLLLESGEQQTLQWRSSDLPVLSLRDIEGTRYVVKKLLLPSPLSLGYHRLTLEVAGKSVETFVISAPMKAYAPPGDSRTWGAFLPLYALHTRTSWGSGSLSDLEALASWVQAQGGGLAATLPLLAAFLDEPFEPGPYAPVSRLFWNELYIDVERAPELALCPSAQAIIASTAFQQELDSLRKLPFVDYRRQMATKRRVLEELAKCCFEGGGERLSELQAFVEATPGLEDYARFRAAVEKRRASWHSWPQEMQDGRLTDADFDESSKRYHLYVQWLAHQQLSSASAKAREKGLGLYLDLPLGAHPDGYDTWRHRGLFVLDAAMGAPPDDFFVKGQDWGLPPMHPERLREERYAYYLAYLRNHLKHAGILRVDHVMGMYRVFWVPRGFERSQGVYVHYPADEFYAMLTLESQRHKSVIVGEDLGTVPSQVRPAMAKHGLYRMYVAQFEAQPDPQWALNPPQPETVASVNGHDIAPFAAWWQGLDIHDRRSLGLLDEGGVWPETDRRQAAKRALVQFLREKGFLREPCEDVRGILSAVLAFLRSSPARVVLVNVEDLWLDTERQNTPGTTEERPNWRRKAKYPMEDWPRV